jgi:hypothetical protein
MDDRIGRLFLFRPGQRGLVVAALLCASLWATAFAAIGMAAVPPGRGLEQVSPPDKNGGDAVIGGSQGLSGEVLSFSYASPAPGRVVYNSFGAFAGAPSGYLNQYLAERTPSGWINKPLTPRQGVPNFPDFTIGFNGFACENCGTVIGAVPWPADPEDENEVPDVYTTSGNLQWERQSIGELPNLEGASSPVASANGSVYAFLSTSPLTASATESEPGTPIAYFRIGGVTRPVAEKPDGKLLNAGGSRLGDVATQRTLNGIASDGYPIFFESPLSGGLQHVYARLESGEIIRLDESQCSGGCAPQTVNASWVGATPDGRIAYFTTDEQLLDSATPVAGQSNLYSYELGTGKLTFIAPDTGYTNDNAYTGLWGASDDGSRLYIVSRAVLAANSNPAGVTAAVGEGNINNTYLVEYDAAHPEGRYVFLGRGIGEAFETATVKGVSPSGRYAMLWTNAQIAADYEGGTQQVYLFDALTEEATCLSCDSSLSIKSADTRPFGPTDGGAVLFSTPQPLDPTDVNGKDDVYLHEGGAGGANFLLSGGQNELRSEPVGMSRDGTDAYFATFARLLESDIDGNQDVYDARVGGGFPDPVSVGECEGDGCSGTVSPPPAAVAPGSSTLVGPPNRKPKRHKHRKRHRKHRHSHRHHIHRASRIHG